MSATIEFYSANPEELIKILSSDDDNIFFREIQTYPSADFSLHLVLPEDLDLLCQVIQKSQPSVPSTFRELIVKQVWYDGVSESLTLISDNFVHILANFDDNEIQRVAADWSTFFEYQGLIYHTKTYISVRKLWEVARDVVARQTNLLMRIVM